MSPTLNVPARVGGKETAFEPAGVGNKEDTVGTESSPVGMDVVAFSPRSVMVVLGAIEAVVFEAPCKDVCGMFGDVEAASSVDAVVVTDVEEIAGVAGEFTAFDVVLGN